MRFAVYITAASTLHSDVSSVHHIFPTVLVTLSAF